MIDFLVLIHSSEEILSGNSINPADIEVEIGDRLSDHVPLILFSDMFHNGILGF